MSPTGQSDAPGPPRWRKAAIVLAIAAIALGIYLALRSTRARRPFVWSGTVETRTINVGSRAGGRVAEVLAHEGDVVVAAQPIVLLEAGDLLAQRVSAEGQLAQAEAALEKLLRGPRPEELEQARAQEQAALAALAEAETGPRREEIRAAEARLRASDAVVDKAARDARRARRLVEAGAGTRADADAAESALRTATADRDAQRQAVAELRRGTRREAIDRARARLREAEAITRLVEAGARREDVEAARGQVDAARGRLEAVTTMLSELTIRAPRPARVETLDLRPGDLLAEGATAAVLVEDDQLYVRIYVPETQLGYVRIGLDVPITVDSWPGRTFKGRVSRVSHVGEYTPRNLQTADERANQVFAARVDVIEGREHLRAGMAASVEVPR